MSVLPIESPVANDVLADALAACRRIAPLWDLPNYVAVNPFLGFVEDDIAVAAAEVAGGLNAEILPKVEYYRSKWSARAFNEADLRAAGRRHGWSPAELRQILDRESPIPLEAIEVVSTWAERATVDRAGVDRAGLIARFVSRELAAAPEATEGIYRRLIEAAQIDRSFALSGWSAWSSGVQNVPSDPEEALRSALSPGPARAYFYRLLGRHLGWASWVRRTEWPGEVQIGGLLFELLAALVALDGAVLADPGYRSDGAGSSTRMVEDIRLRRCLQDAWEDGIARSHLNGWQTIGEPAAAVDCQAVFCIDVRSEPLRRHLEAQSDRIETLGFAGFFGVALEWVDALGASNRCPVLLQPAHRLTGSSGAVSIGRRLADALPASPGAFSFVELLGAGFLGTMVRDAWARRRSGAVAPPPRLNIEIALLDRIAIAEGILKNTGLANRLARWVVLCGHGGRSENNPHAAGLECGACGGHDGGVNARTAAAILNDPAVRAALGDAIPAGTRFVAALHDTSTDEVAFFDNEPIPADRQSEWDSLRSNFAAASVATRGERAPSIDAETDRSDSVMAEMRRRSADASEVRPEWGLARNALFVAARRGRTRGVDLKGRAFLHEYDAATDTDGSVLALILAAPMVVASWINLQYLASTVDNDHFGCGVKALQNRLGNHGVILGGEGDLRTGLGVESVTRPDGSWYHEPVRLQVVIEASPAALDAAISANELVRRLVENGWLRMFALARESSSLQMRESDGRWAPAMDAMTGQAD